MADGTHSARATAQITGWFAVVLQLATMILLATENISNGLAVALMGIVGICIFPALAHIKDSRNT